MKLYKFLPLIAVALLASACGPSRYTAADVNLAAIEKFAIFQPYAYIIGYDAQNTAFYDGTDSKIEADMLTGIIESERYPFSDIIPVDYFDSKTDDLRWVSNMSQVDPTKIDRLRPPKSIRSKLQESGYRYGVIISTRGYIRSRELLQRQAIVRAAARVLDKVLEETTGKKSNTVYYYPQSSPYGNEMYLAVIDGETDRVVHFAKENFESFSHPTNRTDVNNMLHRLLKDFNR